MPYTVKFLDKKLYQSLSFDADMKFPNASDYTKKIWVLKKYKSQGGKVELIEFEKEKANHTVNKYSSYSLRKSFKNDELVVEVIQHYTLQDDFDFFCKAELEEDTGDESLNEELAKIKESDFSAPDHQLIFKVIFDKITGPAENLKFGSKEEFKKSLKYRDEVEWVNKNHKM